MRSGARGSANVGIPIESLIKRKDLVNAALFHHGQVEGVPRGKLVFPKQDGLCALNILELNWKELVHETEATLFG